MLRLEWLRATQTSAPRLFPPLPARDYWTGKYAPCERHATICSATTILILAVRDLNRQRWFSRNSSRSALDFWSGILDLDWHEVGATGECSLQLVDGTPSLFN